MNQRFMETETAERSIRDYDHRARLERTSSQITMFQLVVEGLQVGLQPGDQMEAGINFVGSDYDFHVTITKAPTTPTTPTPTESETKPEIRLTFEDIEPYLGHGGPAREAEILGLVASWRAGKLNTESFLDKLRQLNPRPIRNREWKPGEPA